MAERYAEQLATLRLAIAQLKNYRDLLLREPLYTVPVEERRVLAYEADRVRLALEQWANAL